MSQDRAWPGLPSWYHEVAGAVALARYLGHPEPWRLNDTIPLWWRTRIETIVQAEALRDKPS